MPSIQFEGHSCELRPNESVLDGLLRSGFPIAHSCKSGSCGSCMMKAIEGTVPAVAQTGLKESWKALGYFLSCVCRPESDLSVARVDQDTYVWTTITGLERLNTDVLRVTLVSDSPLEFHPGQYVTLLRDSDLARSYSIASLPEEGALDLHVRRIPNGRMSGWLHDGARIGDRIQITGPSGDCFYTPGAEARPMLLVGTGTGLAPLYGILRDALRSGHQAPIHLFHGAVRTENLYLTEELRRLAAENPLFEYTPSVLQDGPIDDVVMKRFPRLSGWRGYVCGDPGIVRLLRKKLFLAGMASRDIHSDAFLPSAP